MSSVCVVGSLVYQWKAVVISLAITRIPISFNFYDVTVPGYRLCSLGAYLVLWLTCESALKSASRYVGIPKGPLQAFSYIEKIHQTS